MIARASHHLPDMASGILPAPAPAPAPDARQREAAPLSAVGARGAPWADPARMSRQERIAELGALWAAAYARWKALASVARGEPSCGQPRAPGAAHARRGRVHCTERTR